MTTTVLLSADQAEIRDVARNYLQAEYGSSSVHQMIAGGAGFDEGRWRHISDLGWPALAIPEEHGGIGLGAIERCLLLEEMGRVLLPTPYFSSAVLAADMVACAASPDARAELLPHIADGSVRATLVAAQSVHRGGPLRLQAAAGTVSGSCGLVLDADQAQLLVVVAADGEKPGIFIVDPAGPGVRVRMRRAVDPTRRVCDIELDNAPAERIDTGGGTTAAVDEALDRSTVALAAEAVGAAGRCVELTVDYVRIREQFGVPIGSFQAIKHRCADMIIETDAAREAVFFAADVIESGQLEQLSIAASATKIAAAEAFVSVAGATIQLHGGIGFTWEHDAHLFYKRALLTSKLLGTSPEHRDRLATALDV